MGEHAPGESFASFLDAYAAQVTPQLRYGEETDLASWQTAFRARLDGLRGPLPERVAPKAEVVDRVQESDHTRLRLRIPVTPFSTLIAYLLLPHDLPAGERRPALLVSHGHAPYGMDSVCGVREMEQEENRRRAYALSAVRSGYVVMAPAWWGWAGRDGHVDSIGRRDKCNVIQMAAAMYGMNVLSLHIQDAHAAIDVLTARPEVNAERIGCLGNSYGGRTCMWFTLFDPRIKACVASGSMNTFRERSQKLSSCGIQYLPGVLQYGDVPELFGLIAPRPLQLQAGEGDALITPADRDHIHRTVRDVYRRLDAEDRYSYVLHDQGHMLLWEPAWGFLKEHL